MARTFAGGRARHLIQGAGGSVALAALVAGAIWVPANAGSAFRSATASSSTSSAQSTTATPVTPAAPATAQAASLTAGLGPMPKDPAGAARYRADIAHRITLATSLRATADRALAAANVQAAAAARDAIQAERAAGLARDRLTMWASYLYRVSGNTGLLMAVFNDPTADPLQFLRGAADADSFSQKFIDDLETAHTTAVFAAQKAAAATTLRQNASTEASAAEAARQTLVAVLGVAQTTSPVRLPGANLGQSGPQTVVDGRACPRTNPPNTLRGGSDAIGGLALCRRAVSQAATPQAALAIQAAFQMLGAPYACGGVGRQDPFRFDCSSLVSRAYYLGAGIDTAGKDWAPSTRDMVPWDGVPLAWWASYVDPRYLRPGDLVLYDTGGAAYRHVVMYLGSGFQLETNSCGDVAHVSTFSGFPTSGGEVFLVARRVIAPGGYRVPDPKAIPTSGGHAVVPTKPKPGVGDPKVPTPKPSPAPKPIVTPAPTTPAPPSPSTSTSSSTTPAPTDPSSTTTTTSPPPTSPSTTSSSTTTSPPTTPCATTFTSTSTECPSTTATGSASSG